MTATAKKKKAVKEVPAIYSTGHLPVADIEQHPSLQARVENPASAIEEYSQQLKDDPDTDLPPIDVYYVFEEKKHYVVDGNLRLESYRAAGIKDIPCNVRRGTFRDAILFAVGANYRHGMRRTNADKERAVRILLDDDEWKKKSDNWIARECRVSNHLVAAVKERLDPKKNAVGAAPQAQPQVGEFQPKPSEAQTEPQVGEFQPKPSEAQTEPQVGEFQPDANEHAGKVLGQDGVWQAAAKTKPLTDEEGLPVQPHAAAAFAEVPKFSELLSVIRKAEKLFNELANSPGGEFLKDRGVSSFRQRSGEEGRFVHPGLERARKQVQAATPTHTVCPWNYVDAPHPEKCATCNNLNWTPVLGKNIPAEAWEKARKELGENV